ncbi:MAG: hypothetical protein Q4D85_11095 [Corynebacterium sp.]|uniref:hypothetical protein n=1 Tax=Corynebacterium sp. TaxID=1720 RepID=UPI0026DBFCF8|nr:hypothetical protein [Corynebacterium sp.]MDO5099280.1 hypothetical protein [Corynebacterium sp.]
MPAVYNLESHLHPFPNPEDVFAGSETDIARAGRVLLPLISIDLRAIDSEFPQTVHLLSPVEPEWGELGESTQQYHTKYGCQNWLGFKLDSDNRYEFLGDWRLFEVYSPDAEIAENPDLADLYDDVHESYRARKTYFDSFGTLAFVDTVSEAAHEQHDLNPPAWLDMWAEEPGGGNWTTNDAFPTVTIPASNPAADEWPTHTYPVTDDGRRFRFIAAVAGSNYSCHGADAVLLFFDPETSIVLLTFDWM